MPLNPPWNIYPLVHKDTLLFDPRVMAALEQALGMTQAEIFSAIDAYLVENPIVESVNGVTGIWRGSQVEYDALPVKDPNVLYIIL